MHCARTIAGASAVRCPATATDTPPARTAPDPSACLCDSRAHARARTDRTPGPPAACARASTSPLPAGRHRCNGDRHSRTTDASTTPSSMRSRGNSDSVAHSSNTSIDLRHARSCEELISPRYSTWRCTTRQSARRRFSTIPQYRCTLPSSLRVVARRNTASHYPHARTKETKHGLHDSGCWALIHRPAVDLQRDFFATRSKSGANPPRWVNVEMLYIILGGFSEISLYISILNYWHDVCLCIWG